MAIEILGTDQLFDTSPNAGDPGCLCSRCNKPIEELECPVRCWTENDQGEVDGNTKEYRFCNACQVAMGIVFSSPNDPDDDDTGVTVISRTEHLQWCKQRALEYVKRHDLNQAFASFQSDMTKHPETAGHLALAMGMMLLLIGNLSTTQQMEDWITGFN